ncbi:MAG: hypothetical protein EKK40_07125 [Bradyrhizobiaceae bacterium]|nr:MAG: hypothetical protein EKK40_07125 [Bradyrhizobiaceae bacterium]
MKLAPFDDPEPFILLPLKRGPVWLRALRGLRLLVSSGSGLKKHRIEGTFQTQQAMNAHPKMGHNNAISNYLPANALKSQSLNGNVANSAGETIGRTSVNEYEWGIGASNSANPVFYTGNDFAHGCIAHDGSIKFFKWDNDKGCMVPFEISTPFLSRFRRSYRAFLASWRLG